MVPSSRHTFSYGGTDRSYRLYQPEGLAKQSPLVVVLHALGANTVNAEQSMGWDKQADQGRFAVVYPEGIGWTWNANGCCGEAGQKGTDDVGFITAVIDRVPDIDRSRIYVTGFSNGGLMAYTLACTTDIFAAIGPVAATQVDPCRSPHPTSVMAYHNLDDPTVRFGGTPKGGPFLVDGPPVAEVIERWRRIDECGPPVETVVGPRTTSTAMCADNREVALITNADGGHAWPKNFETGLWKFFARHAK
ncbi:MAG: polyhydroxybutyrate depolymerase [Mycobacterium sp.]|jgi:polyhydroxybutyrate depolymerase|nr:polyhydroxybutyrate depolymerase [Mycobacterium sp.]